MSSSSTGTGWRRVSLILVLVGAVLFGVYQVLKALDVANIGAAGDIGGGMILLLAYALLAVGIIGFLIELLRGRNKPIDR